MASRKGIGNMEGKKAGTDIMMKKKKRKRDTTRRWKW